MPKQFIQYEHHGNKVWAREDLRGTHREHCLCYSCSLFRPGETTNCVIAQELYELDVKHNLTTPVFECGLFDEKK